MDTFATLIDRWPGIAEFADDLGIPESHARTVKARGSIPPRYWPGAVAGAKRRGIDGVDHDVLARLYAAKFAPQPEPVSEKNAEVFP